ncbi:LuxR C-terminal-related transcriptional regulator, partial [Mycobacterium sp. 1465703.0]|uniref:LuxR C-terminal-related transcriptional regulator n=1 Tax=Mycobacterium sp. 1465703.0 TaxID=1834078 RepID=UPI00080011DF
EDGDRLRFRHDLLREATRQSLPQSLRRAMERQSASVMLGMGAAPAEVATQLARSAEPGDREAIDALRQAAQSVGRGDASAAADLSQRALELLPANDAEHGSLVAETVGWLNRASRYREAEELAVAALAEAASPEVEAEIRLRLPTINMHSAQRRVEENRRALQLGGISEVTRARHLALLAYNLLFDQRGQYRGAADEAAAAATATGDLESKIVADVTLACVDCGDGYAGRALRRLEKACALARTSDPTPAHDLLAAHHANLLAVIGRLDDAAAQIAGGTEQARREHNAMALDIWADIDAWVHLAAGRLSAARAEVESLPRPQRTAATDLDMIRMAVLAEVAVHTDDRNLLQQTVNDARNAYPTGASTVRRAAAHTLALAAWQRGDVHEAVRWLGGDISLLGTPLTPEVSDLVILGARVASTAGDAGLRARVLQATEALEREQPPVPLFSGIAGYARGILERDIQALVAAAELLHSSSRPLLYAGAAEDAGGELSRAQRNAEALDQLNAAFDTYIECEATADARRVGRALRRLGVERRIVTHPRPRSGWDSLTDAELKVINLIAEGATNRSVATQLHLSPHTVKTHIHNAFAKLGITSRAQLAQLMRGTD